MSFSLDNLNSDTNLSALSLEDLEHLASDIRKEILETVSRQGGHLASNLGVVELVLALHYVFDFSKDRLFFDTGHQCYTHKILTGRRELFHKLRATDGCCGFPLQTESGCDAFAAGHSGTAISAALGFAAARDIKGGTEKVVALVGDGAIGNGCSLEGLNNIAVTTKNFLLVLNDNKMSISPNVGAISRFLNRVISGRKYNKVKKFLSDSVKSIPYIGGRMKKRASRIEGALKSIVINDNINLFSDLGLKYIGPVDGHDIKTLVALLQRIKDIQVPVVLHVRTRKGRGYTPAEQEPCRFHGTSAFNIETGTAAKPSPAVTFSNAFGGAIKELRKSDDKIVAITAGMASGTGLSDFAKQYPASFFDAGIAESHAAVFAAGLATAGMKPVFAVYASFSQRCFDHAFHDVFLQKLHVVFCLDRAGIVADGPTHHGIQDIGFWRMMHGVTLMQPSDSQEVREMLEFAVNGNGPAVIRYPSGNASDLIEKHASLEYGRAECIYDGNSSISLWTVGRELETGLDIYKQLHAKGIDITLVNSRFIMPFDKELMLKQLQSGKKVYILENHVENGGFGSIARDELPEHAANIVKIGWPNEGVVFGNPSELREKYGMTSSKIIDRIVTDN